MVHINLISERSRFFGLAAARLAILRTKPTLVPQILMELAFAITYLGKAK